MSCENLPESTEAVMPRRRKFDKTGICIKCKTEPGKLVIRHAVYCKTCFLSLVSVKFRHVLDPTINPLGESPLPRGVLRASGNLMIGFSGGLGSTVLLDLVKASYFPSQEAEGSNKGDRGGKKHPRKRGRIWDRVIVCYVDCSGAYPGAKDRTQDVKAVLEKYEDFFELQFLRLENIFEPSLLNNGLHVNTNLSREDLPLSGGSSVILTARALLETYLAALPTATSRESSISSFSRLLLQYTARAHGCSHLLLGTSLTSLSVNLIGAVASGAGFAIGMEKAEDWWEVGDSSKLVRIVRPLREISMKECAAYVRWRNLTVIANERILSGPITTKGSIDSLTKGFIFGLERDYPSTVSAIVRTCDKLVVNREGQKCILCERPVQNGMQEWKERISIRKLPNGDNPDSTLITHTAETSTEDAKCLAPWLCYACHTTLTSRGSHGAHAALNTEPVRLPDWVGNNMKAERERRRAEMKEQFQQFLLDDV